MKDNFKKVVIDGKECVKCRIDGGEYLKIEKACENYWANSKKGVYGKGLIASKDDIFRPVRTGMLGELAFGMWVGVEPDFSYKDKGDQQDFVVKGLKVDVKTATRNYNAGLIRYMSEGKRIIPISKDLFVFCYLETEDRENKFAEVVLVGYIMKEAVMEKPTVPARRGYHWNKEVPYAELKDIGSIDECFNAGIMVA